MRRDSEDVIAPPLALETPWGDEWSPEAIISLLEPMVRAQRRERLLEVIAQRVGSVTVVMDAPHDPHNGAAVLRTCDAFGVQTVHVIPREEAFLVAPSVAKGTERWIDVIRHEGPERAVEVLERQGYELVATHPKGELLPGDLRQVPRLALVLGNEHDGIREALARASRRSVRIPMRGFVESLNVSVSAAVLLSAATDGRRADLSEGERRLLYARGLYRTVPRVREILEAQAPPRT